MSVDTVGHEWTHGINGSTAKLFNSGESGAANESFSDIFGTMVEFFANNQFSPPDFLIGEDFGNPVQHHGLRAIGRREPEKGTWRTC